MAAFSYNFQNNNIMNVDYSVVQNLQNPPPIIKMHGHTIEPNNTIFNTNINDNNNNNNGCPEIYSSPAQCLQEQLQPYTDDHPSSVYVGCYKASDLISSIINDPNYSLAYKICTTTDDSSSSVTDKLQSTAGQLGHGHGEQQQQQQQVTTHEDERSKYSKEELFSVDSSYPSQERMDGKRTKRSINNNNNGVMNKVEGKKKRRKTEGKKDDNNKKGTVVTVAPPPTTTGYIHVRARRGQATDNHSLAERVRREKISERMKMLQALVPGCHKVTGKALLLDEIINYVQSLQNQVEFLSMKLASLNPMFYDFGLDLDSFITRPHQTLCSLEPAILQNMHQMQPPIMVYHDDDDALANNIANNCGQVVVDSSPFQFLPQNNIHSHQAKGQVLWDVEHDQ